MKEKTFDWIWKQIAETIDELQCVFSEDEKTRQHFELTYGASTKQVIWKQYNIIKNNLKMKCYTTMDETKIDQHKIASCFCKAFIDKKVFSFDVNDEISPRMLLINYELAYTVSLRIIYIYLVEFYIREGQTKYKEDLIRQKQLLVPETTKNHDRYHEGRKKTLAMNDYYGISFDLLTYSDMMYWIEHYNRQLIEGKINIEPDDPLAN